MYNRVASLLISAGVGAGMSYLFDPDRGRRRRALLRDQMSRATHRTTDAIDATSSDVSNRARGLRASVRSWWGGGAPVNDAVLTERVRAVIGRVVTHPASIDVQTENGHVIVSGPILADEVATLLRRVRAVREVASIEDRLEAHEHAGNVPGLQGQPQHRRMGGRLGFREENWSPSARLTAGLSGGMLALYGFRRRGMIGYLVGASGAALLTRAATNMKLRQFIGLSGRRGLEFQKTIHINAPVERVFEVWENYENFPQFMSHVRNVRRIEGDSREKAGWRWTVTGPAGTLVEFDTVDSAYQPNRLIAWRTTPSSVIQHSGIARFQQGEDGTTTVNLQFTYNPIAGAAGHAVAKMLGADPKRQMDDDLLRMKSFIETGARPHDAAARTLHH
jgi:uncharacterized membrane protein